ncbi:arylsulfate sulfotransferase [Aequitasia blattaphilus]|uniref:Aryl-sulfate sulfotransferase n=1 Tax=Aequitasia blattaphilus TaxID=2949332 RepID=A0ABT1E8N5_9FIRM|nr:aryl-sulfate sulfotransferase [Aequitasia blattaphilus]MCP1102193.1 aryl-sulfate sulfotransferase [Aequitasia blattaphilus]MCR8614833.1 aryl-sulfate sulfotransferase [Aequitasia blattaphilus]
MNGKQLAYEYQETIRLQQEQAEAAMMKEFECGNYTFENPLIKLNPYLIAPLSAVVLFETEEATAITVIVHGKEENGNISHTYPKERIHILPVYGLYQDYENKVEIQIYNGKSNFMTIKTEKLRACADELIKMDTTYEYLQDDLIFVSPVVSGLATAYDYKGDIRWRLDVPTIFDLRRLENGNVMMGSERRLKDIYFSTGLYELSMTGKIYKEYKLPGGYHHDQFEMPDGNIVVVSDDFNTNTVEDIIVLMDRETGEILKEWDVNDVIDASKAPISKTGDAHDWFHCNGVWYDEKTHSLTLSGRHCDAVINIDFETGALNWIIGDPKNWEESMEKYFFTPVGEGEFDWQYEQHACLITPNGDVMCFDNGHWRSKDPENFTLNRDNFSRGVRYKINTEDMTIEQVWQYGKERGPEFFSQYICNVEYYNEGHYMVHSGGIGYYDGETAEMMVVFDEGNPKCEERSITVEVLNDKVMLELELNRNYYRAEKMKIYDTNEKLVIGRSKELGTLGVTKTYDTQVNGVETHELLPEDYDATLLEQEDRILFEANLKEGQLALLILEKDGQKIQYQMPTSEGALKATCAGDFIHPHLRNTAFTVTKCGLWGEYDVKVLVDDKIYETGIKIHC